MIAKGKLESNLQKENGEK